MSMTKALIIDDNMYDGYAIGKALSSLGICSIYTMGKKKDTPKLLGIRLIIVDLMLVEGSKTENAATLLKNTIEEKLHKNNGPYIIIVWTRMEINEAKRIVSAFNRINDIQNYMISEIMEKDQYETSQQFRVKLSGRKKEIKGHNYNIKKLTKSIANHIEVYCPMNLLFLWEKRVSDASSLAVSSVSNLALKGLSYKEQINKTSTPDREIWGQSLAHMFRCLVKEIHGPNVRQGELVIRSLCEVLDPVLLNQIEAETTNFENENKDDGDRIIRIRRSTPDDLRKRFICELSGFHNTSSTRFHHKKPRPGDVFDYADSMSKLRVQGCNKNEFLRHSDTELLVKGFFSNVPRGDWELAQSKVTRILLDITPVCDYQRRLKKEIATSRFIVGLVVPSDCWGNYRNSEWMFRIGPLSNKRIAMLEHESYLLFDYFRIISVPIDIDNISLEPLFRVSSPLLARIQTLFGSHALRQGVFEYTNPHQN